jgi:hypothetical protein
MLLNKEKLKKNLKKFPLLFNFIKKIFIFFNINDAAELTKINITETFPLFTPRSSGSYSARSKLTISSINKVIPSLISLQTTLGSKLLQVENIENCTKTTLDRKSSEELKLLLESYGSDKTNPHNYHYLYGPILSNKNEIKNIFEIGLGTKNINIVSNMGVDGKVGASLRAFRDYCPNANIVGADIDREILFTENRISTYFVDQTKPETLDYILPNISNEFDLLIDDGLHSPNANIAVISFAINKIKKGGWIVIEDISDESLVFWQVFSKILPPQYSSYIIQCNNGLAYVIQS